MKLIYAYLRFDCDWTKVFFLFVVVTGINYSYIEFVIKERIKLIQQQHQQKIRVFKQIFDDWSILKC